MAFTGPESASLEYLPSSSNALSDVPFLSLQDLESFDYVPRSLMVLQFGKPWGWSIISYVHSQIGGLVEEQVLNIEGFECIWF